MNPGLAIETLGLRKTFRTARGRLVAVEGLDLRVPTGGVHCLLGPAGAGKTTTVRMLLGLARPDAGAIRVFGVPVPDRLAEVAERTGVVLEGRRFFPGFSGRRSLTLLAAAAGVPRARVDEVLELAGLTDRAADLFGTYSAEAVQRLAVAAALLRDPELLVLDEPTSALDPAGVRDVRSLVRNLADQGCTVLLTSHVLAEAQQLADTVSVLAEGRLVAQGPVADLLGDGRVTVRARVAEPALAGRAAEVLRGAGVEHVRTEGEVVVVDGIADPADVTRALARQKLWVSELVPQREDLAGVLLRLAGAAAPSGGVVRPVATKQAEAPTPKPAAAAAKAAAARLETPGPKAGPGSKPGGPEPRTGQGPKTEPGSKTGPGSKTAPEQKPAASAQPKPAVKASAADKSSPEDAPKPADPPGRVRPGGTLPPGVKPTPSQNGQSKHKPANGPEKKGGAA
ncbi:ATP-binding cassette domain-containing protein [Antribacter gilvus]|uniref:ATP-binding cassette domain-containing protein n=1 Tax=Antribacter gilvus TaxID=2304675 RepID=UPI001F0BE56A|nr:ABC transporter ATP-binding protein [Antribacter gilvus]